MEKDPGAFEAAGVGRASADASRLERRVSSAQSSGELLCASSSMRYARDIQSGRTSRKLPTYLRCCGNENGRRIICRVLLRASRCRNDKADERCQHEGESACHREDLLGADGAATEIATTACGSNQDSVGTVPWRGDAALPSCARALHPSVCPHAAGAGPVAEASSGVADAQDRSCYEAADGSHRDEEQRHDDVVDHCWREADVRSVEPEQPGGRVRAPGDRVQRRDLDQEKDRRRDGPAPAASSV